MSNNYMRKYRTKEQKEVWKEIYGGSRQNAEVRNLAKVPNFTACTMNSSVRPVPGKEKNEPTDS